MVCQVSAADTERETFTPGYRTTDKVESLNMFNTTRRVLLFKVSDTGGSRRSGTTFPAQPFVLKTPMHHCWSEGVRAARSEMESGSSHTLLMVGPVYHTVH